MNVLITGGAGYVGYSLVKQLLEDTADVHSITIYDNLSRKNFSFFTEANFDHKPITFIHGDILDGRTLISALDGIDCVVHLAAKVTTPYADHDAHFFDQINHWGSAQVARAVEQSQVSKCIYLSSISVYGESHELTATPVNERTEPHPHTFYGISKLAGERQFSVLSSNRELYTIRSGNVYGYNPSFRTDSVINRFMFNAHFLKRIQIMGSGEQLRSFIHVDKIAAIIVAAIDGKFNAGLWNAVEHNLSINQIAGYVRELNPAMESVHVNYNIDMRSIQTELPCKINNILDLPDVSFEDELRIFKQSFSF